MSIEYSEDFKGVEEMMKYVIRDTETDEIVGISEEAPDNVKKLFERYMNELDSLEPVER